MDSVRDNLDQEGSSANGKISWPVHGLIIFWWEEAEIKSLSKVESIRAQSMMMKLSDTMIKKTDMSASFALSELNLNQERMLVRTNEMDLFFFQFSSVQYSNFIWHIEI